jgi:probable HAF family extracellular repeat protein
MLRIRYQPTVATLVLAAVISSCGGGESPAGPGDGEVASVQITPATATLSSVGETIQLTAVARYLSGEALERTFVWSSDDSIASVDADGLVTAVRYGEAVVNAAADGVLGAATITIITDSYHASDINNLGRVVGTRTDPSGVDRAFLWTAEGGTTDLGSLGGIVTYAEAINDLDQVVGISSTASQQAHAFLWTAEGGMVDLTPSHGYSKAVDINNLGQVVVNIGNSAFLWTVDGGLMSLGTLGGSGSTAAGINELGQVVGSSTTGSNESHAFLWTATGGMTDLGTMGGSGSHAWDINNLGQVVGNGEPSPGASDHAFIWTADEGMMDLGTIGHGDWSNAQGINDLGHVVGNSIGRAFLWTADGGMMDLGTLGGRWSTAWGGLNELGHVVGSSETATWVWRPYLWTPDGGMVDLGSPGGR